MGIHIVLLPVLSTTSSKLIYVSVVQNQNSNTFLPDSPLVTVTVTFLPALNFSTLIIKGLSVVNEK